MTGGRISGALPRTSIAPLHNGGAQARAAQVGSFRGHKVAVAPPGSFTPRRIAARETSYTPTPPRRTPPQASSGGPVYANTQAPPAPARGRGPVYQNVRPQAHEDAYTVMNPAPRAQTAGTTREPAYANTQDPPAPARGRGPVYQNVRPQEHEDAYTVMNPAPRAQTAGTAREPAYANTPVPPGPARGRHQNVAPQTDDGGYTAMNPLPQTDEAGYTTMNPVAEEGIYSEPDNIYEDPAEVQRARPQPLPGNEVSMTQNPAYGSVGAANPYMRSTGDDNESPYAEIPARLQGNRESGIYESMQPQDVRKPEEGVYEEIEQFQRGGDQPPPLPPRNPPRS